MIELHTLSPTGSVAGTQRTARYPEKSAVGRRRSGGRGFSDRVLSADQAGARDRGGARRAWKEETNLGIKK